MRNSIQLSKLRNNGMNIERNCTYVNLGLMLLFLGNLGLIHSHFNTVLRLVVCSVLFSYINRSKAGDCVQSQLKNLSRIKESRTDQCKRSKQYRNSRLFMQRAWATCGRAIGNETFYWDGLSRYGHAQLLLSRKILPCPITFSKTILATLIFRYEMMEQCWKKHDLERPTFGKLSKLLEEQLQNVTRVSMQQRG